MEEKNIYDRRGVSSGKEDVHRAIEDLDKGLYPMAFCKIMPDEDDSYCNIMHADGAGTKSSLAYAYWKETGDLSVWRGIAQDALVMNLDDLLCVGVTDEPIFYTSTIGRNKNIVSGEVIKTIINGTQEFIKNINSFGFNLMLCGGETADVGDLVRTIIVDGTMFTRIKKKNVIECRPQVDDVIIGFPSTGKATYEQVENSGIGSNGLTSARHDIFNSSVRYRYPESYDNAIDKRFVYRGKHRLNDPTDIISGIDWGKLVLSPTRTYAPIIMNIIRKLGAKYIHAMIHCSGGGQTKVLNFLDDDIVVVKDNLYPIPKFFTEIQTTLNTDWWEMFKTFNMGHRMELYCNTEFAPVIISIAKSFNIEAKAIGHCLKRKREDEPNLVIKDPNGVSLEYFKKK